LGGSETALGQDRARSTTRIRRRSRRADLCAWLFGNPALEEKLGDVLAGILEVSSEGVVVVDNQQRILLFSKGAEAMFGHKASELIGQPLDILIPADIRPGHGARVEGFAVGAAKSKRMAGRKGVLGLRKTGEVFPLEVGLSKVATHDGHLFTAILRDISEQTQTQTDLSLAAAQANAANEAKSSFLAAMSHEIRTPLNGVLGMAQAMSMEDLPAHQRDRLDVIRQSGENLLAILNDLLDLSKIEAGKLELEDTEFDLDHLVRAAHGTFAAVASAKGLDFELSIAGGAKGVYRGDALRVRQILHNLVSNALKFTETGGVRVAVARSKSGMLRLVVEDTGIGIPPEQVEHLFRKFEQGDATTTRRFGGTGLGLAICRDLAERMGGSIALDSQRGRGATFTVLLPLVKVGRASPPLQDSSACRERTPSTQVDLRVLVAEDNGVNQLVLKTLLNQAGIEPAIVEDGLAAVAAWEREPWDVILMDIQMPNMDGPTATGLIRGREAADGLRRTPIIALTANAMDHQAAEYARIGMDGLVPKPIEVEKLFTLIAELTDR
jgi:PAS domain S-box-containing protein